jgi:hypothetical protein
MPTPAIPFATEPNPFGPTAMGDTGDASLLERFVWRMGHHGMSVSLRLMIVDPAYAVQQMAHARQLHDAELDGMALALFARFQRERSGLANIH